MTPEDWKKVEDKLAGIYGFVELMVAEHKVSIHKVMASETKLMYATYVDGCIKGEWVTKDCMERAYMCEKTSCINNKIKMARSRVPKKVQQELIEQGTYKCYTPCWGSIKTIKSQYRRRFGDANIELIEEGTK